MANENAATEKVIEKWWFVVINGRILQWSFAMSKEAAINLAVRFTDEDWKDLVLKKKAYTSCVEILVPPNEVVR